MNRLIVSVSLAIAAGLAIPLLPSCTAAQGQALIQPSEQLGICILQAAVGDIVEAISDPLSLIPAIISSCGAYGVATVEQVIAIIEQALSSSPADAGATVAAMRLATVHSAALAFKAAKK